jgi:CRP-like cAMP-binding protein
LSKKTAPTQSRPAGRRPNNRLLAALPDEVYGDVKPYLRTVVINRKEVLARAGERLESVYFLNGGVASMTAISADGAMVEVASIGNEGLVGIEAFLGPEARACGESVLQVPDARTETSAVVLTVKDFRGVITRRGRFEALIGCYAQFVFAQMMQSTACNALHPVPQRCARWLLETHDRMYHHRFHLSHEFLATMLGVQRPTVTVIAGILQDAGLISYTHGKVTILDRTGLEAASCDCFRIIQGHYRRLLPSA